MGISTYQLRNINGAYAIRISIDTEDYPFMKKVDHIMSEETYLPWEEGYSTIDIYINRLLMFIMDDLLVQCVSISNEYYDMNDVSYLLASSSIYDIMDYDSVVIDVDVDLHIIQNYEVTKTKNGRTHGLDIS